MNTFNNMSVENTSTFCAIVIKNKGRCGPAREALFPCKNWVTYKDCRTYCPIQTSMCDIDVTYAKAIDLLKQLSVDHPEIAFEVLL